MMLIFLALALAIMPLFFAGDFTRLALLSTYAAMGGLALLAGNLFLIWFGMRSEAIFRVWRRRTR